MALEDKVAKDNYVIKPHAREQLQRFYNPVLAAQNEIQRALMIFEEFVAYLRKDMNVPPDFALAGDFSHFKQVTTQVPPMAVGDAPQGPDGH